MYIFIILSLSLLTTQESSQESFHSPGHQEEQDHSSNHFIYVPNPPPPLPTPELVKIYYSDVFMYSFSSKMMVQHLVLPDVQVRYLFRTMTCHHIFPKVCSIECIVHTGVDTLHLPKGGRSTSMTSKIFTRNI